MKIKIKTPDTPYDITLDPGVNEVDILEPHIGVRIINGSRWMSVSARDDGFEIHFDGAWYDTHSGEIKKTYTPLPEKDKCDGCGTTENVLRYENAGTFVLYSSYVLLCDGCLKVLNSVALTKRDI